MRFRRTRHRRGPQALSAELAAALQVCERFDATWGTGRPLDGRPHTALTVPGDDGPSLIELCDALIAQFTPGRMLLVTESWSRTGPDRPTRFLTQTPWRVCDAWGGPERDYRSSTLYVSWALAGSHALEQVLELAVQDSIAAHLIPEDVGWLLTPRYDRVDLSALSLDRITAFEEAAVLAGGRAHG
jgi:hypothetical protein